MLSEKLLDSFALVKLQAAIPDASLLNVGLGLNPTVWINDAWCAHEIFEKKAQIYASRPRMVVFGELGTGQSNLVTMRIRNQEERDHWRIHRKLMHIGVGVQSVRGYRAIQNNETLGALCDK
ncbi:hypothetical protein CHGG_09530 [Chaetomium globosum CBS 148.51]|uniref:Uncharacterized protein n=1 Tax=Chaetomium globosum (strain ATCC 6205 / CBS 148.51 / DSM 1962 / NBRC 6347 / NRRL 1970) TaxID=306901 RepID=Q2GR74_CHAGB|nr:uncharacterized protein CHGG_09530 [Chaetomium globosum CBS 148.51]EAQ85516.1 hypothetical protein CHGG_09530 [Chaetomium globosum CBS 148.51]